ncbi:MAG TPA: HipA family kinase [Bryobacteraceae bacterium]|nr:HipA family kinase [Bryobacteraceae bacterium]
MSTAAILTGVIEIKRVLRRMRGSSQACLVEGADGECYVTKFQRNPQGTRTLINEWITWRILERLDISTPEIRLLRLSESTRDVSDDSYFSLAHRQVKIEPGLHLGSRCPVDPRNTAIFDFLPQKL